MENRILGLHHITAIASDANKNLDFYTRVLGLRLVKKTVNFDDPGTYHFYFGNESGEAGTILTFFPWQGIGRGRSGAGMATHIGYAVAKGALGFWKDRLSTQQISFGDREIMGEKYISFQDPDGLELQFIEPSHEDKRKVWTTSDIKADVALKGFHNVTLTLRNSEATARVLTDIFGYQLHQQEGNRLRFATDAVNAANLIDILEDPSAPRGHNAAGTNHHIAFRVKDEKVLMEFREKILSVGMNITPKIDRDYFYSLYFREPGGVLFEIATDNPGFTVDEPLEELGAKLMLPKQYEGSREEIEGVLPELR
ncbi:MAG TPA: ring-cleaving dioxygenase [Sphingobacteriaceae bacterium]|nr:ring-cleaving dioxygenase [Sphingobacteriaceae bacterium]